MRSPNGSIRQVIFDQRKSDYLQSRYDRPAVFIEQTVNIKKNWAK